MKPVSNPDYYRHTKWESHYDADCSQYQVIDDAKVIATGIESPGDAKLLAAAPELLKQRDALLSVCKNLLSLVYVPDHDYHTVTLNTREVNPIVQEARKVITSCAAENR